MLRPRIMQLHWYIDYDWLMTPIDFQVARSKVKVTVTVFKAVERFRPIWASCLLSFYKTSIKIMSLEYLCGKQKAHLKVAQLYFRPQESRVPDKEEGMDEFLFVHQSNAQKHLLERYGQEICLLDATYKTCKFDVPLFCVCV
ncbi:hypothetical protein DPMN_185818 [Dreissena polymorpha]|uniref:Uncharacterized protein n=1 Tax=Dreissena polymorpha TaxID=45954 RepID=A0A9D4DMZ4_DREPO|nr:hypothetical protein DPMN_185818 [Dreissena polymorpha]